MNSPYLDLICYNLKIGVAPQRIADTNKCVFGADDTVYQITNLKKLFFNDVETVRGKTVVFNIPNLSLDELLPFSIEDIRERNLNSLSPKLVKNINRKLKCGEKLDPTEAQLLMNLLNYKLKSKEIKQMPLLEEYVDPTKEDMIFEGVEYDE